MKDREKKSIGPPWKIERTASKGDYTYAVVYGHPNATMNNYVLEHRVVMENHIGRVLLRGEIVHHKDENKKNNDISNLELVSSNSKHMRIHRLKVGLKYCIMRCPFCEKVFERWHGNTFELKKSKYTFCSKRCSAKFYFSEKSKKPFIGNLISRTRKFAPVAQLDEQRSSKSQVPSSSLGGSIEEESI